MTFTKIGLEARRQEVFQFSITCQFRCSLNVECNVPEELDVGLQFSCCWFLLCLSILTRLEADVSLSRRIASPRSLSVTLTWVLVLCADIFQITNKHTSWILVSVDLKCFKIPHFHYYSKQYDLRTRKYLINSIHDHLVVQRIKFGSKPRQDHKKDQHQLHVQRIIS